MKEKRKTIASITMVVIGLLFILYLRSSFKSDYTLNVPELSDVVYIELQENEKDKSRKVECIGRVIEVYDVILKNKKNISDESISDTPVQSDYIKIDVVNKKRDRTTLFAYEGDNEKYFIEQPYNGIYEITGEEYNIFAQYFL